MTKLTRETQEIFANSAGSRQITAFGTAKSESPTFTKELTDIQNTNYLYGWAQALLPDKAPFEEDMNALFYAITRQLAYIFQQGIPEYDQNTEYTQYALCRGLGVGIIYQSQTDENIGNPLDDTTYWLPYITGGTMANYEIGAWQIVADDELLPNETWLEGGKLLKTASPVLTRKWGNRYAPSDATDTDVYLYLPDCRKRAIYGADGAGDFGYIEAGLPDLGLMLSSEGAHNHTRGTMNITGATFGEAGGNVLEGAFYQSSNNGYRGIATDSNNYRAMFDASRSWTGSTTTNGIHTHKITTTSPVLGTADTVLTPGIKVRVKTRYY